MAQKPTTAFYLSAVSGILLVLGGIIEAANVWTISFYIGSSTTTLPARDATMLGTIGVVFGLVMISSGAMLYSHPEEHVPWGAVVLILSFLSIFTSVGGLVIGILLGVVGGIKAIRWTYDTESDRVLAIYDKSGLDGVVSYLIQENPNLTSAAAISISTQILADRDRLVQKANQEKLRSFPSNQSTVQGGTNTDRSERETNAGQVGEEKKSWIDKWLKR